MGFGGQISNLIYEPNYNYLSSSSIPAIGDKYNAVASVVYIDNKINLVPGLLFQPLLNWSSFSNNGKSFIEPESRINLSYSPNLNQSFNVGVENKIETDGKGTTYGAELMLKKNTGKWTGSLGYAWSYADRTFVNINGGKSCEYNSIGHITSLCSRIANCPKTGP